MDGRRLVSADNHLNTHWLPADLWQRRLPAHLRDLGPRVVETDIGSRWLWEGALHNASAAGSSWARLVGAELAAVAVPPGALPPSEPALVRAHMDLAGVHAAIFFGDTRKWRIESPELRRWMYRAYNDYCLELSALDPGRLVYLPCVPTAEPAAALEELRRLVTAGVRAVELDAFGVGAPLADPLWWPLWEAAEAAGVVVCSHTGHRAGTRVHAHGGGRRLASHATSPFVAAGPVAELIFAGVLERHPKLTFVMAESRIGWLPFFIAWMDRQLEIRGDDPSVARSMLPSEIVRRQVRFTFEHDVVGARLLAEDWSGLADIVMWGCDYPHPQGVWPDPSRALATLDGLDPGVRDAIVFARAARLFGVPDPSAHTGIPSTATT